MNEREAIVAWLRNEADRLRDYADAQAPGISGPLLKASALDWYRLADRIERGDHLKGQTDDR